MEFVFRHQKRADAHFLSSDPEEAPRVPWSLPAGQKFGSGAPKTGHKIYRPGRAMERSQEEMEVPHFVI